MKLGALAESDVVGEPLPSSSLPLQAQEYVVQPSPLVYESSAPMHRPLDRAYQQSQLLQDRIGGQQCAHRFTLQSLCPICFDTLQSSSIVEVSCEGRHRFCRDCLARHIEVSAFPKCPAIECSYELTEENILDVCGEGHILEAHRAKLLQRAILGLHGRVVCPNINCGNVVICDGNSKTRVTCPCGHPSFCSGCRQGFHYRKSCAEVQQLRAQWLEWITRGRAEYNDGLAGFEEATQHHQERLRVAMERYKELEEDEYWKAERCRLCPKCFRTIEKTDGCSSMVCGTNYHGGNTQPGCGQQFDWNNAPKYQPRVERKQSLPSLEAAGAKLRGALVRHFFVTCNVCNSSSIRGPRFRCVHCESFDCCLNCEGKLGEVHPQEHVFEIILEPSDLINEDLPVGTEVEIFGLEGTAAVLNGAVAKISRYLCGSKSYDLDLPFGGESRIPAMNIQPVGADTADLAQGMLENGLAQQDARNLHLGLCAGQKVQLGESGILAENMNAMGSVVTYRPDGIVDYQIQLDQPDAWSCSRCTLRNPYQQQRCGACNAQPDTSLRSDKIWLAAGKVSPIIQCAEEVKKLAQMHWSEQQRFAQVELANPDVAMCNLDLPEGQLVHVILGCKKVGQVISFDPEHQEYKVGMVAPHNGCVEIPAISCTPVLWDETNPLAKATELQQRHIAAETRLREIPSLNALLVGTFFNLQPGQWVHLSLNGNEEQNDDQPSTQVVQYTEQDAWRYEQDHGVPPPSHENRGIIVKYKPVFGKYMVRLHQCKVVKEVACSSVHPVLWTSLQPQADFEHISRCHQREVQRLSEAGMAVARTMNCNLDLPPSIWVECNNGQRHEVTRFDPWTCSYTVCSGSEPLKSGAVQPIFLAAENPMSAADEVQKRHAAEQKRRAVVATANANAKHAKLGLPSGTCIEVGMEGSAVERLVVQEYLRESAEYKVRFYGRSQGMPFMRSCSDISPVFWLADDPSIAAADAMAAHKLEMEHLNACMEADALASTWNLGMQGGTLVSVLPDNAAEGSCQKRVSVLATVLQYLPEWAGYAVLYRSNQLSIESGGAKVEVVPFSRVQPSFINASNPRTEASERGTQHQKEVQRLKNVNSAHRVLEAASCTLFNLLPHQMVEVVGEGVWRRPGADFSCHGVVVKYTPVTRTYAIRFGKEDDHTSLSDVAEGIAAHDVKPLLWEAEDPIAAADDMIKKSLAEQSRMISAHIAREETKDAHLNLPSCMVVERATCPLPVTVFSYCRLTQTYVVCGQGPLPEKVPASEVVPYMWNAQNPAQEAARALSANNDEEVRCKLAAQCEADLLKAGCVLDLPGGLPVRLLQRIPVASQVTYGNHQLRQSWREWLRESNPFKITRGCAADDVAHVHKYNGDGTYTLRLQDCPLRDAVRVDGASLTPLLACVDDPLETASTLLKKHEHEVARLEAAKEAARFSKPLLGMPVGTPVLVYRVGVATVMEYAPTTDCYTVACSADDGACIKSRFISVPSKQVLPALHRAASPTEHLKRLEELHQVELSRLASARAAHELVVNFPRDRLPVGTRVEFSCAVAMPRYGQFQRGGRIVQGLDSAGCYTIQLDVCAGADCLSSDSMLRVSAKSVQPVFWREPSPRDAAISLGVAMGMPSPDDTLPKVKSE